MKNFTDKFKVQFEKKKEADLKSSEVKKEKEEVVNNNVKGKIILLSHSELKERKNIRDNYDYEQIENLAKDILMNGQLEPVVITLDNYLLWGYRRYKAMEMIVSKPDMIKNFSNNKFSISKFKKLVCYQINKYSNEISDDELQELQFSENNERRDIDNFQLSKLYNSYLEKGFSQSEICTKFSKSKAYVSAIVSLKAIDDTLVKYLKEFQVYGCSKEKFIAINSKDSENIENSTLSIYSELKKFIGWQPLYSISKHGNNIKEQKIAFLKLFKSNLTKEELDSEFFEELSEKSNKDFDFLATEKQIKSFSKTLNKIKAQIPLDHQNLVDKINKDILELTNILSTISS